MPTRAVTFVAFVQSVIEWMREVYRPQIEQWIDAAHKFTISRAQARLEAFVSSNPNAAVPRG